MAQRPPIAQFPSAKVCGCGDCWKKKDRPLRCSNHSTNNVFIYETRWVTRLASCFREPVLRAGVHDR
ncbi:hypothetical protein M3Y99_01140500 [Aphelenchoides fujianensis]|nr:hypothetical protein M3Y99_01140500 [Aphelenchoides fujianensis]